MFVAAMLVMAAICVLTVDVGRIFVCQAQLQNAVDAAAVAGAVHLVGFVGEDEKPPPALRPRPSPRPTSWTEYLTISPRATCSSATTTKTAASSRLSLMLLSLTACE